jgi:hypothetical protein
MALKMNAAIVEEFGEPFVPPEWDIPSPSVGQIQVKTEACGVCQTDLHAARGDWPVKPTLPFIPGHEAIGVVTIVGPGVTIVKEGDRVGAPWLYSACGHCEHCLTGWETVCAGAQFGGYTRNGGFAECLLADLNYVAHVTAGLGATEAAPLIHQRIQAGCCHDPEARHMCPGRASTGRVPGSAPRCSGELHHHSRFVRRHASRYGRSACLRGRYRAAASIFNQPNLRPARAWRRSVTRSPRIHKVLRQSTTAQWRLLQEVT